MTFNFGSGTTSSSTPTGTFSFGNQGASKPPVSFAQPSASPSFTLPTTGAKPTTGTPSAFSFGTSQGTPSTTNNAFSLNTNPTTSPQNKPPIFGGGSTLTTSGALPKSGAPSAFSLGNTGTPTGTPSTGNAAPSFNLGNSFMPKTGSTTGTATVSFGTPTAPSTITPSTTTTPSFGFPAQGAKPATGTTPTVTTTTPTAPTLNFSIPTTTASSSASTPTTTTASTTSTTTAQPQLAFSTLGSTGSTTTTTTTTTPTQTSAEVNSMLKGKSLDSILNSWGNEINTQADQFMQQAHKIAEWDLELMKNNEKLSKLKDFLDNTSFAQDNLDRKLELIKEKQNDVDSVLKELEEGLEKMQTEQNVSDFSKADKDRKKGYKLGEDINSQIDVIQGTLEDLVSTLNERRAGSSGQEERPEAKIMAILNDHLITLQWIDQATLDLDLKVKEIEKTYKTFL